MPVILESGCPRKAHTEWSYCWCSRIPLEMPQVRSLCMKDRSEMKTSICRFTMETTGCTAHLGNSNWLKSCFVFSLNFHKIIEETIRHMDWLQAASDSRPCRLPSGSPRRQQQWADSERFTMFGSAQNSWARGQLPDVIIEQVEAMTPTPYCSHV